MCRRNPRRHRGLKRYRNLPHDWSQSEISLWMRREAAFREQADCALFSKIVLRYLNTNHEGKQTLPFYCDRHQCLQTPFVLMRTSLA